MPGAGAGGGRAEEEEDPVCQPDEDGGEQADDQTDSGEGGRFA